MREVRMTFGEHLEELRRRIIFCIIYLFVGVSICFVYGETLLEWTLRPHHKAISGAQRDRLVARMTETVAALESLTTAQPERDATSGELAIPADEMRWEVLFASEIVLSRMRTRLEAPVDRFASALGEAHSTSAGIERTRLVEAVQAFGDELSGAMVQEFGRDLGMGDERGILPRVRSLIRKIRDVEAKVGPSKAQEAIGWGRDLATVLEPLGRFEKFLELRRDQLLAADIVLDDLRDRVRSFRLLPERLDELLTTLEEESDTMLKARDQSLMVISYLESFNAYLKVSVIFGVVITIPFILYELWKFIGAGLHAHEQKWVVVFLPFSLLLFAMGAGFGYYAMIPVGLEFLAGWGISEVDLNITLANYVGLFFTLTLILGLVFQTPLVMIFLTKIGIVDTKKLRQMRRISVFLGVCLAVVLTPPDPFSWSLMALPMIVLYEVGIILCDLLSKEKDPVEVA